MFPPFPKCVFVQVTLSFQITMTAPRVEAGAMPGSFLFPFLQGASLPVSCGVNLISGINKSSGGYRC